MAIIKFIICLYSLVVYVLFCIFLFLIFCEQKFMKLSVYGVLHSGKQVMFCLLYCRFCLFSTFIKKTFKDTKKIQFQ
jgi:hypothetical protein